jgi:predicted transposase YdaD
VTVGQEEILRFHYRVIALWKLQAQDFLERHAVRMYALLPTMQGTTYHVLREALDAMKEWYGEDRRRLAEHILLFDTFLRRSEMVSPEDKQRIEEELDMFESLLEESRFVQKARAEGMALGKSEGLVEGEVQALQQAIIEIVEARFPSLTEQAKHAVETVKEPTALHMLIRKFSTAPDENIARWLLDIPAT